LLLKERTPFHTIKHLICGVLIDRLEMNPQRTRFSLLVFGLLSLAGSCAMAATTGVSGPRTVLGNDDDTYVFMGRCPSGEIYRLVSYDKEVNGLKQSFYDYEGPAGKGTVKTKTAPRVMMSRVCLALAEIAGDE
jgi:hypothetical protein